MKELIAALTLYTFGVYYIVKGPEKPLNLSLQKVTLICKYCNNKFDVTKKHFNKYVRKYCSKACFINLKSKRQILPCNWCGKKVLKERKEIARSKSGYVYCSYSCSSRRNNNYRKRNKRSKCEIMLYELLRKNYPQLEMIPNDNSAIGLELDIYLPKLKLAIEWNGIVHFRPIYGQDKLSKIQSRDAQKMKLCDDIGINLIVIPDLVSTKTQVEIAYHHIVKILADIYSIYPPEPQ